MPRLFLKLRALTPRSVRESLKKCRRDLSRNFAFALTEIDAINSVNYLRQL